MAVAATNHRVTATVTEDTFQRIKYWADKKGISVNEYLCDAIDLMIAYENKDYDLPNLEQARLNQLIDQMVSMSANIHSLEMVVTNGFDSLIGLTRGDNYLLEHEDGEIG